MALANRPFATFAQLLASALLAISGVKSGSRVSVARHACIWPSRRAIVAMISIHSSVSFAAEIEGGDACASEARVSLSITQLQASPSWGKNCNRTPHVEELPPVAM